MQNVYRLLKKPFFGRFMVPWRSPLDPERAAEWRPLRFASDSGGELAGLVAEALAPARGIMVLGHPMGKEAKGFFLKNGLAQQLREAGFHVLVFDFNGFGESGMGSFAFDRDALAAGIAARALYPDLPLGYHGVSLGGMWVTIALADPAHPFEFAVIESAAPSLESFWVRYPAAHAALRFMYVLRPKEARRIAMAERLREARGVSRVLFVYSKADTWVPLELGRRLIEACPVPSEVMVLERAEHAMVMRSDERASYVERLLHFYDEVLRERAA